jgi:L-threonylcarbamoyladenylate synthase
MSAWFDCANEAQRAAGLAAATTAVLGGELVVLPTDTVYGVGADAFSPAAVRRLLAAKGRGPEMPPPVLVGTVRAANALVEDLGQDGQKLISEFWPGALTIVCRATRSLSWDLGETKGTVAVRMPEDAVALDLLRETGPMAVSSANLTGAAAATTAEQAREQLGEAVSIYLDGGTAPGGVASTIVDLTGPAPRLLRRGAISVGRLREVVGVLAGADAGQS